MISYVQTDDGLVGHDKVVTSGVYDKVTSVSMDTVITQPIQLDKMLN